MNLELVFYTCSFAAFNIKNLAWRLPDNEYTKHTKKKLQFYFLFILVRTTTKFIQFINKPVFLF
jgi:hypothetical protein